MPITWVNARAKVRGDLWRPGINGIPDDVCDRALHASLLELEAERRWLWLENIVTPLTMSVEADHIDAPLDLRSVTTLALLQGATAYDVLTVDTLARVRAEGRGSYSTWPSRYALSGGKFYFDATVPQDRQFELIYTARTPEDLDTAVAASSNVTLNLNQTAIIANACHYACLSYLKNDEEAARQRAVWARHLDRLTAVEDEARGDLTGGSVTPDTGYQDAAFGRC